MSRCTGVRAFGMCLADEEACGTVLDSSEVIRALTLYSGSIFHQEARQRLVIPVSISPSVLCLAPR